MDKKKRAYNRIKAYLALKGFKNKALAEHLSVSEQTVSKWCTNYSQPSIPELFAIADFLEVSVCDLLLSEVNKLK
jgi:putative transcriptional regulator